MAKSGFVPAWMKLPSSDKINVTNRTGIDSKSSSNIFPFRRSCSRERTKFSTSNSINNEKSSENFKSQRRLHSVSSSNPNQSSKSIGFDQEFPSLKSNSTSLSTDQQKASSIWNNAAAKLRSSNNDSVKFHHENRLLSSSSNRSTTRKDRLLNSNNVSTSVNQNRPINSEFHTNYITQMKNIDKRSDFLNSLKNHSINKPGEQIPLDSNEKIIESTNKKNEQNGKLSKTIVLLLSVPESSEEKEFLKRMGWKESDEIDYEITDQDKEDYEKRLRLSRKNELSRATLMLALRRRTLPSFNINDLIRSEQISVTSDEENSDD